jgi:hypothetical protein
MNTGKRSVERIFLAGQSSFVGGPQGEGVRSQFVTTDIDTLATALYVTTTC